MADIMVFGLDVETVPLDDIQMDVPHAQTVIIPEDKAIRSKDLWRALSQKRIFRLSHDPSPKIGSSPSPVSSALEKPVSDIMARLSEIMSENASLREENARLQVRLDALKKESRGCGKLDEILQLLRGPQPVSIVRHMPAAAPSLEDLVEVDAPAFVPSEIRPKDVETRVEVSSETSRGRSVSGATEALRRLRQSGQ